MDNETISSTLERFTELVTERISNGIPTTEDSIRYLFFYALTSVAKVHPNRVVLEYGHPIWNGKEIDFGITGDSELECAGEIKYDRRSKTDSDRTAQAGAVFHDIFKLASFKSHYKNTDCYLLYLTDQEMISYFRNQANRLDGFFDLDLDKTLDITEDYIKRKGAKTFEENAQQVVPCSVRSVMKKDDVSSHSLRVYLVEEIG